MGMIQDPKAPQECGSAIQKDVGFDPLDDSETLEKALVFSIPLKVMDTVSDCQNPARHTAYAVSMWNLTFTFALI